MSSPEDIVAEISSLYTNITCGVAVCALLVYDWLLCFDREVRFMWNWQSGVTLPALLYGLTRYTFLARTILDVTTIYPMSDIRYQAVVVWSMFVGTYIHFSHNSCTAVSWGGMIAQILGTMAISAFSALRAYALSSRNGWLAFIIILLALPPFAIAIVLCVYQAPLNLPSPYNCSFSNSLSPALNMSITLVFRAPQLAAELLVIAITWWYTYQWYRIRNGIELGKTISSFLFYNGSLYFLFIASLYIIEIILDTAPVPINVANAYILIDLFSDPITSLLVCRFMLSLREFDTISAESTSVSAPRSRSRASTVLKFGAAQSQSRSSGTLPTFIASFAHPVHVDSTLSDETDYDPTLDDEFELESRETRLDDAKGAFPPGTPSVHTSNSRSPLRLDVAHGVAI